MEFRKLLYYFAHPYTGYGETKQEIEEANFRLCSVRTARLVESGYAVFSPIIHSHPVETSSPVILAMEKTERHALMMQLDFIIISRTNFDGIILAPNWQYSKGCTMEHKKFMELNKPVLLYNEIVHG